MARIQLASLGSGVVQNSSGAVVAGINGTITLHGTQTPVSIWSAETGGTSTAGTFTTDSFGRIPGWVDTGVVIDITAAPAPTVAVDLSNIDLPVSVVVASSGANPRVGNQYTLGVNVFYPEDPQWAGGADSTTADAVPAFQAIIDYCTATTIQFPVIRMGPKYTFASAPRTDRQGNAQLALPTYNLAGFILDHGEIRFQGASGGTVITTTQGGASTPVAYSSSHGTPSVIGGPTIEGLGGPTGVKFSNTTPTFENVQINLPNNPSISGVDASRCWNLKVVGELVIAGQGDKEVQPTNVMFGVYFPEGDNDAIVHIDRIRTRELYVGEVISCAHPNIRAIDNHYDYCGIAWTGNEQLSTNDGHSAFIGAISSQESVYHMASWDPVQGVISAPTATLPAGPIYFRIGSFDIEDWINGNGSNQSGGTRWYATSAHILDANNQMNADLWFNRVIGDVGPVNGGLIMVGGLGVRARDVTMPNDQLVRRTISAKVGNGETTIIQGGSLTLTLPLNAPPGTRNRFVVNNNATGSPTISNQSTDVINHYGTVVTTFRLQNPMEVELEYGYSSPTTLTTALTTDAPITSLQVASLARAVQKGQLIVITSGTSAQTYTLTADADATTGPVTLAITSITPTFAYPIGSLLTFGGVWNVVRGGFQAGRSLGTGIDTPGARASYAVAAGTLTALDTANLKYQVLGPPSGNLDFEAMIDAQLVSTGSANKLFFGVLNNAGGAQVGNLVVGLSLPGAGTIEGRCVVRIRLTGLTPGTLYVFNLAAAVVSAAGNAGTVYAHATQVVAAASSSPAEMKAYAV